MLPRLRSTQADTSSAMNSATIVSFRVTGPQQQRRREVQPGTGRADGLHDLRALQRAVRTRELRGVRQHELLGTARELHVSRRHAGIEKRAQELCHPGQDRPERVRQIIQRGVEDERRQEAVDDESHGRVVLRRLRHHRPRILRKAEAIQCERPCLSGPSWMSEAWKFARPVIASSAQADEVDLRVGGARGRHPSPLKHPQERRQLRGGASP
mmetsp:Transcript_67373/g.201254  ORF Transcript_67373/g.201254 Transcript_67373/m.201254 type:complete len:212 (-) Transcript_67373:8-643(-)